MRDHGQTLSASVGDHLTVRLEENPTSGYRWTSCGIGNGLAQVADRYDGLTSTPGAAGMRVFKFHVIHTGVNELCLVNRQEWDPEDPAGRFHVKIHVV